MGAGQGQEARNDLSNTRTCKNQGTVLWHSNVSAPSARKLFFGNLNFVPIFLLEKNAPAAHFCGFQNPCPSPKINGGRSAVCDGARMFEVALLAVGVGQGWGAVEAV